MYVYVVPLQTPESRRRTATQDLNVDIARILERDELVLLGPGGCICQHSNIRPEFNLPV